MKKLYTFAITLIGKNGERVENSSAVIKPYEDVWLDALPLALKKFDLSNDSVKSVTINGLTDVIVHNGFTYYNPKQGLVLGYSSETNTHVMATVDEFKLGDIVNASEVTIGKKLFEQLMEYK